MNSPGYGHRALRPPDSGIRGDPSDPMNGSTNRFIGSLQFGPGPVKLPRRSTGLDSPRGPGSRGSRCRPKSFARAKEPRAPRSSMLLSQTAAYALRAMACLALAPPRHAGAGERTRPGHRNPRPLPLEGPAAARAGRGARLPEGTGRRLPPGAPATADPLHGHPGRGRRPPRAGQLRLRVELLQPDEPLPAPPIVEPVERRGARLGVHHHTRRDRPRPMR